EGGLIFGLTAALYGEITIDKGRVQQSNFHDYRMLRIDQTPKIEVHVIKSGEAPGGIGETGVTAGPPALRNAIYAATGVAMRRLAANPTPEASDSSCHSARCTRPTSRPTGRPGSAITAIRISSTPFIAASATMARGSIRRCRLRPTPP